MPGNEEERRFRAFLKSLPFMDDPRMVCESVYTVLESMLRRNEDRSLLAELSEIVGQLIGDIPFDDTPEKIQAGTRRTAQACIKVLQTAKEKRSPPRSTQAEAGARESPAPKDGKDVEYWLPPHLAHLLARIECVTPDLPPPEKFSTFDELCLAAIYSRIDNVLVFFQRHNSTLHRELPPIFLFSAEFSAKLRQAIAKFIYPYIKDSRQIRVFATNVDLSKIDSRTFWDSVDDTLKSKLLTMWRAAWDDLKLIEAGRENDSRLMQVKDRTKLLREMLLPPSPDAYDLPRITNLEIDLFASLLNTQIDLWENLNCEWHRFRDFYEQEMDPRVFQQRAREGVLRDNLLAAAEKFPEQWGDFMVLLCHRSLPRITTAFLESYSANIGMSDRERERRAPYLMRYLAQVNQHPEIKERERTEESKWEAEVQQLRQFLKGFP